ncbi:MAG: hypothetical protein JWN99_2160 [Ilumatobacteraceae bacterium]|nr:hypothetical protein [Ilumatobacteraceae bacterium]
MTTCRSATGAEGAADSVPPRMTWVDRCQHLNRSFQRVYVHHVGASGAGFFSEFNNVILAMLYCVHHRIQFRLTSANASFAVDRGFDD